VDRLLTEIPGITNWALTGLKHLSANKRFENPAAGEAILRDFVYLSSPMQAFLDECCEVQPAHLVRRKDIQLAWKLWCEENGHVPGSIADFGRKLRAVLPKIVDEQRRVEGQRDRWYVGFTVNADTRNRINRLTIGV
jgi:putative DNA primase/helicase